MFKCGWLAGGINISENPEKQIMPCCHVDKRVIRDLYEKYDVLDTLFPLTRSCEGFDYETDNYQTTCGRCWWCLERKWAFGDY